MSLLKDKLGNLLPDLREELKTLSSNHGDIQVSTVSVKQVIGGMRGVVSLLGETSSVDPQEGLYIRGTSIKRLADKTAEEILFLLLIGELPNEQELADLRTDLQSRSEVPGYVFNAIDGMEPTKQHPMTLFSAGVLAMQRESVFAHKYEEGISKFDYWEYSLEDYLNMVARLPGIAAYVYRKCFEKGDRIPGDPSLNWSPNFAKMLGIEDPKGEFAKLIELYMVLHSDHGSGNVSAFTSLVIGSALSDMYLSFSGGLNGLAGPLHGLANQECLRWLHKVQEQFSGVPSDQELRDFVHETLDSGNVIPGYGHAVLRVTDPRFEAFHEFGKQYTADDETFKLVDKMFSIIPEELGKIEKISNPWPNVDAISGSLLSHYGLTEFSYYTVLFGVSRGLGIGAQHVLSKALGLPIIRPKAVSMKKLEKLAEDAG